MEVTNQNSKKQLFSQTTHINILKSSQYSCISPRSSDFSKKIMRCLSGQTTWLYTYCVTFVKFNINKVAGMTVCNFVKKRFKHVKHVKLVKFVKFFRTLFLQYTSYFEEHLRATSYRVFNVTIKAS